MRRIAHISDLHFGCEDPAVVEGLVAELNGGAFDLVIASGDFTQSARHAEFEAARAFLDRLAPPWVAVPGNHDISPYHLIERFLDPFRRYRRFIHRETEPCWQDEEVAVIGVNTVRRMAPELNWSYGRINPRQIRAVAAVARGLPRGLVPIVVGHHPFLPPPWDPKARLVKRASDALVAFEAAGVRLVLAGHLHRGYTRVLRPVLTEDRVETVVESPVPARAPRLQAVQAGSATSRRLRSEPNAYNRITVEAGEALIEARVWTGRAFLPAVSLTSDPNPPAASPTAERPPAPAREPSGGGAGWRSPSASGSP